MSDSASLDSTFVVIDPQMRAGGIAVSDSFYADPGGLRGRNSPTAKAPQRSIFPIFFVT